MRSVSQMGGGNTHRRMVARAGACRAPVGNARSPYPTRARVGTCRIARPRRDVGRFHYLHRAHPPRAPPALVAHRSLEINTSWGVSRSQDRETPSVFTRCNCNLDAIQVECSSESVAKRVMESERTPGSEIAVTDHPHWTPS